MENQYLEEKEPSQYESVGSFILEIVKIFILAFVIIAPVRMFLFQPFFVQGASMEPNFENNEYLIINEISYRFSGPQRGDIIIFRYPKDPSQYFIKRVIGLPGETVKIKDNKVYIKNGEHPDFVELDESEYLASTVGTFNYGRAEYVLEADQYFVMGDNREQSLDSRRFGSVPKRLIIGNAWVRGWPFDKVTIFKTPTYNF